MLSCLMFVPCFCPFASSPFLFRFLSLQETPGPKIAHSRRLLVKPRDAELDPPRGVAVAILLRLHRPFGYQAGDVALVAHAGGINVSRGLHRRAIRPPWPAAQSARLILHFRIPFPLII